ncbi:GGDEF domain-containing protein [Haliea sp. E1-2-M8]|uniref:GGDEF domain-containing protein n=1 Tax=Haliea sp. E1-2-M8 TaxID=3064706 RepID=UPI002722BAFF|nr:GGDEF domain-containing protein [Haliea sp. E1-2-M8]MDO8860486.1 GGDEF domain-containing protein [Haliea sp. E1-2-M8]
MADRVVDIAERARHSRGAGLWLSLPLTLFTPVAGAQQLLGATVTETTLTVLLAMMALTLTVVLVLYRRQRLLTALLRQESRTDYLTHIPNRRYFFEVLDSNIAMASRYQQPLCLAVLDVDYFKKVNDTYGHTVGDKVLVSIAGSLQSRLRRSDSVGRLGGEEFAIQLPMTSLSAGAIIAERLRQHVAALEFPGLNPPLAIRCSIGVAVFAADMSAEALYHAADGALYRAKESGRNRIVVEGVVSAERHPSPKPPVPAALSG